MNSELKNMTEVWMTLERKTLEQRKKADEFYESNLMELITEDYIARNKDKVYEKVKYLVVSVGTSFEPIVLNIKLFQPERIMFLHTAETENVLNKIVSYCNLSANCYEKRKVSETNPLDIYREIKQVYLAWNKPEKMYIDFTGGTKAMSASAAMAGTLIDVQLVYVGSNDYLMDFRKPNPGSELLFYIDNPLVVFGDLEIEKAFGLFRVCNFSGAVERLEVLRNSIPEPSTRQQLNFVYLLAKSYEAWDSLDFIPAYEFMAELIRQLQRDCLHSDFLLMNQMIKLRKQKGVLENLKEIPQLLKERKNIEILQNKDMITALMFTMYQNAKTREQQEKYDMATLLFYRLLEMIEQCRLSHYNLFVSKMEYENMRICVNRMPEYADITGEERVAILKDSVGTIKKQLFGRAGNGYLPEQISLLEGFIILSAFHDPIVKGKEKDDVMALKRIRSMVYLRNNSIFAHGLGPVKKEDYKKFRDFVEEVFIRFCKIEQIDDRAYSDTMTWVNPLESEMKTLEMGE